MEEHPTKPSILVVDDDDLQREALLGLVERLGFVGLEAGDGDLALRLWTRARPAAILLDYHMPGLDGGEVTRRVRAQENGERRPILGISASVSEDLLARWEDAGLDAFLPKPIEAKALAEVLRRWFPIPEDELAAEAAAEEAILDREIFASLDEVGLVDRLYPRYLEALEKGCAELLTALGREAFAVVGPIAHRLRGSSAQLGTARMAALFAAIDEAVDDGDLEVVRTAAASIDATRAATIAEIEAILAARRSAR
ncbi:MAG: response regulator [Nannocystaceae bacterium]